MNVKIFILFLIIMTTSHSIPDINTAIVMNFKSSYYEML